jgi:hypothetical protein
VISVDSRPARETGGTESGVDPQSLMRECLRYARERSYRGPDYGDGMSSRLLRALPVDSMYLNLAVQELVKRAPVDVRPLFRVEHRRNFQGIALFAMTNMVAADLTGETGYDAAARSLADWLVDTRIDGYAGFCGGHRHDLQTLDGVVPVGTPGVVGTSYAVKALLRADERYDTDYGTVARTAVDFVFEDLGYSEAEGTGARIDYKPGEPDDYDTINAVALGARLLLDIHDRYGVARAREGATELLRYVASRQTPVGGWYYRDPPSASHLSMDSHHNGFVIETFQRYRAVTGDARFDDTLKRALEFYRGLFEADGAPAFDEDSAYPRDIHAATQGVIVFSYAGDDAAARRIIDWTVKTLYVGDGRFYFRKHRFHTKRVVLMRWCVAWMAYALGEHLRAREFDPDDPRRVG